MNRLIDKSLYQFSVKELESPDILSISSTPKSKIFISNCLLEAIKAKLRNWNDVKIIYIPKWLNPNKKHPNHFAWLNTKLGIFYEFVTIKPINEYKLPLTLMRGCISAYGMGFYNEYINRLVNLRFKKLEKDLLFKNKIFEEKESLQERLNNIVDEYSKKSSWKRYSEDEVKFIPFDESEKNGYASYIICFSENCHFANYANVAACKVTKNGLEIPKAFEGKIPYWYLAIPTTDSESNDLL